MGGEDEKLARFELVLLDPVYVVYEERATSQLCLDRQHLYIVPAVDWGGDSTMRDGILHHRCTPTGALCGVERVEGVTHYPPLEGGRHQGLMKEHHVKVLNDGLQHLVLRGPQSLHVPLYYLEPWGAYRLVLVGGVLSMPRSSLTGVCPIS